MPHPQASLVRRARRDSGWAKLKEHELTELAGRYTLASVGWQALRTKALVHALRGAKIFGSMGETQLSIMASGGKRRRLPRYASLCREGGRAESFFVLERGSLELSKLSGMGGGEGGGDSGGAGGREGAGGALTMPKSHVYTRWRPARRTISLSAVAVCRRTHLVLRHGRGLGAGRGEGGASVLGGGLGGGGGSTYSETSIERWWSPFGGLGGGRGLRALRPIVLLHLACAFALRVRDACTSSA